jgi:NADH-quinone oxidoreductase subunit F
MKYFRTHVLIGINDTSKQAGVDAFIKTLKENLAAAAIQDEINVLETGPLGFFGKGICLTVYPDNVNYENVKVDDVIELVNEHFLKGRPVRRLMLDSGSKFTPKFNYESRIVLRNSGIIDPESIDEYLGTGGYEAWEKALQMKPSEIVDEVKKSGLRGRGGAGFPTGLKWSFTAPIECEQKYVVVNADEGEPGTFKDRLIMEGDPHQLLEGIMICAKAVGATKSYIYIRGEYKLSIQRLKKAIEQCYNYGLLGKNIFESGFDLDIDLKIGAGAYVCGEETALIESLEGNRGNPRWKPPFPGVKGLWGCPTVVNNVETLANVPYIIKNGAEGYMKFGTPDCSGTKVYTILGDVAYPGLCEADMGTTYHHKRLRRWHEKRLSVQSRSHWRCRRSYPQRPPAGC